MIRVVAFIIITCILAFCDFNEGMNKLQLKVILLILMTIAIHCGAVEVYTFHTLAILAVTLSPAYEIWARRFKAAEKRLAEKSKQAQQKSASPSSPSSVPRS